MTLNDRCSVSTINSAQNNIAGNQRPDEIIQVLCLIFSGVVEELLKGLVTK